MNPLKSKADMRKDNSITKRQNPNQPGAFPMYPADYEKAKKKPVIIG